ncbi:MAG: sigma-70 family RNA polymerase sigma factor [Thermomicrobiales bacterium]|nr:sigma-70 family RNA polymerase sigma factor [Thermomicrobiales bacterium]
MVRDDGHLMAAACDGDLDAFNLLVLRHERTVFTICLRLLRDVQAAEDATQDAFLRAWISARSFQGGSVRAWLLRIATNRAYDLLRVRARRPAAVLETEAAEIEPIWSTQSAIESPEAGALRDELGIYLERALTALPEDQRTVVLLADVQGCSYEETAAAAGAAVGTVKSRLSRGRAKLRQTLIDDPTAAELFDRYRRSQHETVDAPATRGRDSDDE